MKSWYFVWDLSAHFKHTVHKNFQRHLPLSVVIPDLFPTGEMKWPLLKWNFMLIFSPGQVTICKKKKKLEDMYYHIDDHQWSSSYKWADAWNRFLPCFSNWCGDLGSSFPGVSLFFPTVSHGVCLEYFTVRKKERKEGRKVGWLCWKL